MNNQNKNLQIEGLRGIAIILVIIYHLFCRFQQLYLDTDIFLINRFGRLGVNFFLLISSYYVVCPKNDRRWLKKKIIRLWPTYFVSISVTMIVCTCYQLPLRTVSMKDYLLNTVFLNGFLCTPYVDKAHWYLTTVISLYIIIYFFSMVKFTDKKLCDLPLSYISWQGVAIFFSLIDFRWGINLIGDKYIGTMCAGIAIRKWMEFETSKSDKWFIVFIISIFTEFIINDTEDAILLIIAVPIFILTLMEKLTIINNNILVYIGKISYPLYLIHQNIAYVIEHALMSKNGYFSYSYAMISFIIVNVLGIGLYYLVERPFQKKITLLIMKQA